MKKFKELSNSINDVEQIDIDKIKNGEVIIDEVIDVITEKDIEKLIKLKIPIVKEHPYLPSNEVSTEPKKPDLRNKKKPEIKKLVQSRGGNPSNKGKFNFRQKKRLLSKQ